MQNTKLASEASGTPRSSFPQAKGDSAVNEHQKLTMPYSKKKSECERECARSKLHAIGRMHVAKKAKNDCRPFKDGRNTESTVLSKVYIENSDKSEICNLNLISARRAAAAGG